MRGLPIVPAKRSIQYLTPEQAAAYHPKPGEVVFANFYHEGKFWIAKVDPDKVDRATMQLESFGKTPAHVHSNLRFTMKDGAEVELYPQTSNPKDAAAPAVKLKDLIVSDEGFSPSGGPWQVGKGLFHDEFALAYRVKSLDEVIYENAIKDTRPVSQFPLCLEQSTCSTLLKNNLAESNSKGLKETYHLFKRNCTSELFRQIDAVTAAGLTGKAKALVGSYGNWVPGWAGKALACRGLLDKKALAETQNLEKEKADELNRVRASYEAHEGASKTIAADEAAALPKQKRVLLIWNSVGVGHLSAAKGIAEQIKTTSPDTVVVLKDIKDFVKSQTKNKLSDKLYWYLVKNHPDMFDKLFRNAMDKGEQVARLADKPTAFNEKNFLKFVKEGNFDTLVSTYYGGAKLTGDLIEKGELKGIKTGWLHTDYFRGFFPRLSQQQNKSFVPHRSLEETWKDWGVHPDAVTTTGMPLPKSLYEPVDKFAFFNEVNKKAEKELGAGNFKPLDPKVKTVTITGGGEGVGEYAAYVRSLAKNAKSDLQIVAIAGKNEKHVKELQEMIKSGELDSLSKHKINLKVLGFIPLNEALSYVKSSDLYITKSGGLSPTEGFAIGKPMIITDVYGGHERDNADLFEKLGLGLVNRKPEEIGKQANLVFDSPDLQFSMSDAQRRFRNDINLQKIVDFVFDDKPLTHPSQAKLIGDLQTTDEAMKRLDFDAPADVEVIMPLEAPKNGEGSPLAIRVKDSVYAYEPGQGPNGTVRKIPLRDFLYGTERPFPGAKSGVDYGLSYLKNSVSVRIRNVDPAKQESLLKALEKPSRADVHDSLGYVTKALSSIGLGTEKSGEVSPKAISSYFDSLVRSVQKNPAYGVDVIQYVQSHSPQGDGVAWQRVPITEPQMSSSSRVTKRLSTYVSNPGLVYENINGGSVGEAAAAKVRSVASNTEKASSVEDMEKSLEQFNRDLKEQKLTVADLDHAYANLIKDMSPAQKNSLAKNKLDELPADLRERAKDYQALQMKVDTALGTMLDHTDNLIKAKLDYVIDETMDVHQIVKQDLLSTMDEKTRKSLKPMMAEIEKLYKEFKDARRFYGQPVDGPTRTIFFRKFFSQVKNLEDQLAQWENKGQVPAEKVGILQRARETLARVFTSLTNLAKLAPDLGRAIRMAILPKASEPGKIDFSSTLNKVGRKVAEVSGISVEVEGREKVPVLSDPKVVNLYTATHRHPANDMMVMSHFMPDDALLFGAGDQFVPGKVGKKMADMLDKREGFVMVGRGSDKPIESAVAQMKSTGSRSLFIYPEGSVSTGLGETRPVREKFSTGLLKRLRDEGYKVNLIPVTYENTDKPLHIGGIGPEGDDKTFHAKIHDPVTPERLEMMLNSGDDQMVNRYLRSVWLQDLPTDENRIAGQLRVSALKKIVPEKLNDARRRAQVQCIQAGLAEGLAK